MSVTLAGIVGSIGSAFSSAVSGAFVAIKIVASVAFAGSFALAILSVLGGLYQLTYSSIIGEIFSIFTLCLPFNAVTVFGSLWSVLSTILAFLIARKVYMLTLNLIGVSH